MTKRLTGWVLRLLSLLAVLILAVGGFTIGKDRGWFSPLGIQSESHDTQVINAIERTQEVSLLRLSIEGLTDEDRSAAIFGQSIPGTGEKVFLRHSFDAKLGIDGAQVEVTKTSANVYLISVPEFDFIGYAEPSFEVATEDSGVLSWVTPDIDKLEMVNEILNDEAQQAYLASNQDLLEEQTEVFYDSLITSIDPAIVTTFEFRS